MNTEQARQTLQQLRAELESRLARTHKHIYEKDEAVSPKFDEQVKETENDQLVYALDQEAQDELRQIQRALQRLEDGEYFECSRCGADIAPQRLEAIPFTEFCINCAG